MSPETRLHATALSITVAVMLPLVGLVVPWLEAHQALDVTSFIVANALTVLTGGTLYKLLVSEMTKRARRWNRILKAYLGPRFVKGTWAGTLSTKTGEFRWVVEQYEQTLSSLIVKGQSYLRDGTFDASWETKAADVDAQKGSLYCLYSVDVNGKPNPVMAMGHLKFDRQGADAPPRRLSGYSIDVDAGLSLPPNGPKNIKIVYDQLIKLDDELLPWSDALSQIRARLGDSQGPQKRGPVASVAPASA